MRKSCDWVKFQICFLSLVVVCISACNNEFSDSSIEKKAIAISEKLDANSIKTFYEWGFSQRGGDYFFKHSNDSTENYTSYFCIYYPESDTAQLTIGKGFENFVKDFPCQITEYYPKEGEFKFLEINNTTTRVLKGESFHNKYVVGDFVTKDLFPVRNPFTHFSNLSKLKKDLKIFGSSYQPQIGNFIKFYLSSQHILFYLPDDLQLNPKYESSWQKTFDSGKRITKNWCLVKLDEPIDNG